MRNGSGIGILSLFLLALSFLSAGCWVDRRSDALRCTEQADCLDGRACEAGWCVAGSPVVPDAPPSIECPAACSGGCSDGTCVMDCSAPGSCLGGVTCPPDMPCTVQCTGSVSCIGEVSCEDATRCTVVCGGLGSCAANVACGTGPCTISCTGNDSCGGGIECADSCRCETRCDGNGSCAGGLVCPVGCEQNGSCRTAGNNCSLC